MFFTLKLKDKIFNLFKVIKSNFFYLNIVSSKPINYKFLNKKVTFLKSNKFLDYFNLNNVSPNLRNFIVRMAPRFDINSTNSKRSFATLNNFNREIVIHYNAMAYNINIIVHLIRVNNLTVIYNGDEFRVIPSGTLSTIDHNQIIRSFSLAMSQIIVHLRSLNTLRVDYRVASNYLVRDGYTGNLLGNTNLIDQAISLYNNLIVRFNYVSHSLMQNYNLRFDLVNSLESSINRFRFLIQSTTGYLAEYNLGLHQDSQGSVELSFPNNCSLDVQEAALFLQDRDLVINSLIQRIANDINVLNDLETNTLRLDISQMRVHGFITLAAELQMT